MDNCMVIFCSPAGVSPLCWGFLLSSQGRQDSFPEPPLCFDLPPGKRHPERSWCFSPGSASNCPWNREIATHPSQKTPRGKGATPSWVDEMEQVAKKKGMLVTEEFCLGLEGGRPGLASPSLLCREPPDLACHLHPLSPRCLTYKIRGFMATFQVLCGNPVRVCVCVCVGDASQVMYRW